jgi:DNA polymerase III subunit gamma/tau
MAKRSASSSSNPDEPLKPYTVLARRYRSTDFGELVGQEAIARTLQNAIRRGRTAHAYLFCGTRGVGKTSMARIFAKALNLTDGLTEKDAIASAILKGEDIDVIEIDGASNRGVDDARDLIANAGLAPARSPYKIYIIDEVHMLTREAFNALLKTMEEPPPHVKFILCTTEPHRVPATIQSRCQRFDFRAIPASKIAGHLRDVLEREQIPAEDEAVATVARLANGSMRDGLSLLDRLLAGAEKGLTVDLIEDLLGLPDQALTAQLLRSIVEGDAKDALLLAGRLIEKGFSVEQALEALCEQLRGLLFATASALDSEMIELSAETRQVATELAPKVDAAGVTHMMAVCEAAARQARTSSTSRALFDAVVVRLTMSERLASIPALLEGQGGEAGSKKKLIEVPFASPPAARPSPPVSPAPRTVIAAPASPSATHAAPPSSPPRRDPALPDDQLWPAVIEVAERSKQDATLVSSFELKGCERGRLILAVKTLDPGLARYAAGSAGRLSELVKQVTTRAVEIEILREANGAQPVAGRSQLADEARRLPLVQDAMNLLGATIIDVRPATASAPPADET